MFTLGQNILAEKIWSRLESITKKISKGLKTIINPQGQKKERR